MEIQSYVAQLNSNTEWTPRSYDPVEVEASHETLSGIRAVMFDVYGTLIDIHRPEFLHKDSKQKHILSCFQRVIEEFGLAEALRDIKPDIEPNKLLRDFYHGLIFVSHEKAASQGIAYPEVRIEDIWKSLIEMCRRHGYEVPRSSWNALDDLALAMAYLYHFHVLGRRLYPGVYDLLRLLKKKEIVMGVISNAQFYTSFDLSYLLLKQSNYSIVSIQDFISDESFFLSYQYGVAKPNPILFDVCLQFLKTKGIRADQTLYVGNDILNDVFGAQQAGMRACLFAGDRDTLNLSVDNESVKDTRPDLVVEQLPEIALKIGAL